MEKTFENKETFEAIINNKMHSTEKILDNKLIVLTHYDTQLSHLEAELKSQRKQLHGFRDELKDELGQLNRHLSVNEDRVGREAEKANERLNQEHVLVSKIQVQA